MSSSDPLIASLRSAVQASPTDVPLRVHLATLLAGDGDEAEAVRQAAAALHAAPEDADARTLMRRLLGAETASTGGGTAAYRGPASQPPLGVGQRTAPAAARSGRAAASPPPGGAGSIPSAYDLSRSAPPPEPESPPAAADAGVPAEPRAVTPEEPPPGPTVEPESEAEEEAPFVPLTFGALSPQAPGAGSEAAPAAPAPSSVPSVPSMPQPPETSQASQRRGRVVTLADVAGMDSAKERLRSTVVEPLRNPELRRLYRTGITGGVLVYGPPESGKTFLARAVAGELGAAFVPVDLPRVVSAGDEASLGETFAQARRQAPVVICLEDIDALARRSRTGRSSAVRAVNALIAELDRWGVGESGVFVLATTSRPWNVDPSLRRNGRLARTLFVTPPDRRAREGILREDLARIGVTGLDVDEIALLTEGFTGRDLARAVDLAHDRALGRGGSVDVGDLRGAVGRVSPSSDPWLEEARSVAQLEADETTYAGLREYLKARDRW